MRTYIGIVRDHSTSMSSHRHNAIQDYNSVIQSIKNGAASTNIETYVSVVECASDAQLVLHNLVSNQVQEIKQYRTNGNTALYDSVGKLIEIFEQVPDKNNPDTSFLIMAVTDGEENNSFQWNNPSKLRNKISELNNTNRWTFTFRVPKGHYKNNLVRSLGIEYGNVLEWEMTDQGFKEAIGATRSSFDTYYQERSTGMTSTRKFFANVDTQKVKDNIKNLDDISNQCLVYTVSSVHDIEIASWFSSVFKKPYQKGTCFYELLKTETVQTSKKIAIIDKNGSSYKIYTGRQARYLLGLPEGEIKLAPGFHANYDIFIQSTSTNRKLIPNQRVLYWPNA